MSHRPSSVEISSDEAPVLACTLDYFQAWFEGDSERMDRVLHAALAKRSLRQVDPASGDLRSVTKEQMVTWAAEGEGVRLGAGGEVQIDVEVVDLYGNIASVVVRSSVYREYLHLVRTDDGWRIANALWHFT
jgi:Putative lumazine-binding